ncbi:hypothetical protein FB451DRAFT_1551073 [Mycena latifolia]|nr:hypothetical protein FB451DRAFT_1551073 [Mycena latifolia]
MSTTVYPVLTLPPGITAEIFLRCLPDLRPYLFDQPYVYTCDPSTGYTVGYRAASRQNTGMPPQIILSQVCRAWRSIALGTPALWAALRLGVPKLQHRAAWATNSKTDTWFARACDCPLTILISRNYYGIWRTPFLDTFQRHAPRMCVVDLEIGMGDLERMVEAAGPWSFPALQTLSLWLRVDYDDIPSPPIQVVAPLLREVWMCRWLPGQVVRGIRWNQLTELTAQHYSIDNCLSILRLTPNLVRCRLSLSSCTGHLVTGEGPVGPSTMTVVLPHLHALTIFKSIESEYAYAGSADILDFLILPALRTLDIFDDDNECNSHFLDVFLARSTPPLHTLAVHLKVTEIDDSYTDTGEYGTDIDIGAFALLSGLTRLEFWRPTPAFAATLFEDVFARGGERTLLPHLQTLALWGCSRLVRADMADDETYEWEEDQWERDQWADQFGDDRNLEEAFLKLKGLSATGLEVIMENKRRV